MAPSIRLYLPPPRVPRLAGARRDPLLHALGAPPAGGIFETTDRHLAREAVWSRKVALVDPVDTEFAMLLWRCMERCPDAPAAYVGPALHFDPAAFTAPMLPKDGLPAQDAVAAYLAAAPVPLAMPLRRLSLRAFCNPPALLWRRTVQAPPYPRNPEHVDRWQRFELQVRALPSPHALSRWYRRVQTGWWTSFALHRLLAAVTEGAIVAYSAAGDETPATYWASDLDFDSQTGDLFCRSDSRVPLRGALRFYPAGRMPAAVAERAAYLAETGRVGRISQAIYARRDALAALPRRDQQVALLRQSLPHIRAEEAKKALHSVFGDGRISKQERIAELLRESPERSNCATAKLAEACDSTVKLVRRRLQTAAAPHAEAAD